MGRGRRKQGVPAPTKEQRENDAYVARAVAERHYRQKVKLYQDMEKYRVNRERLAKKARSARSLGLSYGYYVALVLENRGALL